MKSSFNHSEIAQMLGDSLIMLDTLEVEDNTAQGVRLISAEEKVFRGHFPNHPILPGVLQWLAMEQACRVMYLNQHPGTEPVLKRVHRVKFRQPVYPGQTLSVACVQSEDGCTYQAKCTLENGDVASSGTFELCERPESWNELVVSPAVCHENVIQGDDILAVIPHRTPFVLLDGVYDITDTRICGYHDAVENGGFLQSKGRYAACFQAESCAQLGCYSMMSRAEYSGKLGLFMSVDDFVVHRPVLTGERLEMELNLDIRSRYGIGEAVCRVGAEAASEISLKFAIV